MPTPVQVTAKPADLLISSSQFPLPGFSKVTDTPLGQDGTIRRQFTADNSQTAGYFWVIIDMTPLSPRSSASSWVEGEDCEWRGSTNAPNTNEEVAVQALGDRAKACKFEWTSGSRLFVFNTGTRNVGVFLQTSPASFSVTDEDALDLLTSMAALQLAIIEEISPSGVTSTASTFKDAQEILLQDSQFARSHGPVKNITFTADTGEAAEVSAFEGEVRVSVPSEKSGDIGDVPTAVKTNGGTIFAQIPSLGLFWAKVQPGKEATFIDAMIKAGFDAHPNLAIGPSAPQAELIDGTTPKPIKLETGRVQLDFMEGPICVARCDTARPVYATLPDKPGAPFGTTEDPSKAATHGSVVEFYRLGQKADSKETNVSINLAHGDDDAGGDVIDANLRNVIEAGKDTPGVTVINMSLGPGDAGNPRTNWWNEYYYMKDLLNTLKDAGAGDEVILVVAAGNESSNTNMPTNITRDEMAKNVVRVGALDENGQVAIYSNYSSNANANEILYVPVKGKAEGSQCQSPGADCNLLGTSFGAPQVDFFINEIIKQRPDLTPEQIREVLFDSELSPRKAVKAPNRQRDATTGKWVTTANGPTVNVPVLDNPYGDQQLQTALKIAERRFGARTDRIANHTPGPFQFRPLQVLPEAEVGKEYTYWFCSPNPVAPAYFCGINASRDPVGGHPPYHFQYGTAGGFPPFGLYLQSNGSLTGKPDKATAGKTYKFTVCAVDLDGKSICQPVSLLVKGVPTPTPTATATATRTPTPTRTATPVPNRSFSITSLTCVGYGSKVSNATGYEYDGSWDRFEYTASGTVTGGVGDSVNLDFYTKTLNIGWTGKGSYLWTRTRLAGEPETTSWSLTGLQYVNLAQKTSGPLPTKTFDIYYYGQRVSKTVTCQDQRTVY